MRLLKDPTKRPIRIANIIALIVSVGCVLMTAHAFAGEVWWAVVVFGALWLCCCAVWLV